MVAIAERELRMLVVHHSQLGGEFFIALVPAELSPEQIEAALRELGVDADEVVDLSGWRTAGCGLTVAHVPFSPAD